MNITGTIIVVFKYGPHGLSENSESLKKQESSMVNTLMNL